MDDSISRETALKALEEISYGLWEIDIPSPTVPEYIEHHEQVQGVMKLVDKWARKIQGAMPVPAEPRTGQWITDHEFHCLRLVCKYHYTMWGGEDGGNHTYVEDYCNLPRKDGTRPEEARCNCEECAVIKTIKQMRGGEQNV